MHDWMTNTRFMLLWVLGGIATLLSTLFFALAITCAVLLLVAIVAALAQREVQDGAALLVLLLDVVLIGGVSGFIAGNLQKGLLREKTGDDFAGWLTMSTVGGALGAAVTGLILAAQLAPLVWQQRVPTPEQVSLYLMALVVLPAGFLGVAQAVVLVRYVRGAWTWVLANMAGGAGFVSLLLSGWVITSGSPLLAMLILLLISSTPAIVSGFAMLWVLRFSRR